MTTRFIFIRPVSGRRFFKGFTLVEMLVVLAIIGIMAATMIPSIGGMMRAYQLETTAQGVLSQLTLARQTAQTQGYAVQVRLYELPDYSQATTGPVTTYRAMQVLIESAPGASGAVTVTPISRPYFFQSGVVFLSDPAKTTLLALPTVVPVTTGASADPSLPNFGYNYSYKVFRFLPSGQTDLAANLTTVSSYCLNVVLENAKVTGTGLPANFQTIQIDGINGGIRSFRP